MEKTSEKRTQLWIGTGASLLSIALVLWLVDPQEVWHSLRTADYRYLIPCLLCLILFLAFRAIRWQFLLKGDVPLTQTFHIQNIGYMLTMLLPFRLGDVARAILIGNIPPITIGRGATTMLVERLLDLLFFVILLPFTLASIERLPEQLRTAALISGLIALLGLALLILAANQRQCVNQLATAVFNRLPFLNTTRWLAQLNQILDGLHSLTHWRTALQLLAWSIILWLPVLLAYYLILRSVDLPVTPLASAFITCVAAFSVAAPSSPGQIGVFHLAVTAAITEILGFNEAPALSFAILYHTTQFLFFIVMGLIGLFGAGTTYSQVMQKVRPRNTPA